LPPVGIGRKGVCGRGDELVAAALGRAPCGCAPSGGRFPCPGPACDGRAIGCPEGAPVLGGGGACLCPVAGPVPELVAGVVAGDGDATGDAGRRGTPGAVAGAGAAGFATGTDVVAGALGATAGSATADVAATGAGVDTTGAAAGVGGFTATGTGVLAGKLAGAAVGVGATTGGVIVSRLGLAADSFAERAAASAAASASATPFRCSRTFSATSTVTELECVFFSVTPKPGNRSMIALALTSSSRASSLIRTWDASVILP
jgi:hypothetical protein